MTSKDIANCMTFDVQVKKLDRCRMMAFAIAGTTSGGETSFHENETDTVAYRHA